jgi:8-hydroxy-5-deazaflavin:NADPH oxidoreductase
MRIAILGTGDVGKALARGFVDRGDEVTIGSRDPEKARSSAREAGTRAGGATFAEAAEWGELAVLATGGSGTENALRLAGAAALAGKVLIDATDPLVFTPGLPPALALGHDDSGGEQVQRWLPSSGVVKAFDIVGHAHMVRPDFPGGPPDMFYCGNDDAAKKTVERILKDFGWSTNDIGGIEGARLLEPMCTLWVLYGLRGGGWTHAFRLLKK